jgi:ABC-2 type transport system permease protein
MKEINAILIIAYRDIKKLSRDRMRMIASIIFPLVFVGALGSSLDSNLGEAAGFSFIAFTFTGVLAMTLFQSPASGIISLIEDRQNDFAQELFISPISRYSIIIGKIIGESSVAMLQMVVIMMLGIFLGVNITLEIFLLSIPIAALICFLGGAFGVLIMSQFSDQRSANQIFPFVLFPQYFLAGVFAPINELPPVMLILSRISPMTYAVDLMRNLFFYNSDAKDSIVLFSPWVDLGVIVTMSLVFLFVGTFFFVRGEKNR